MFALLANLKNLVMDILSNRG